MDSPSNTGNAALPSSSGVGLPPGPISGTAALPGVGPIVGMSSVNARLPQASLAAPPTMTPPPGAPAPHGMRSIGGHGADDDDDDEPDAKKPPLGDGSLMPENQWLQKNPMQGDADEEHEGATEDLGAFSQATGTAAPQAAAAEKDTAENAPDENTSTVHQVELSGGEAEKAPAKNADNAAAEATAPEAAAEKAAAESAAAEAAAAQKATVEKATPETAAPEAAAPPSKRRRLKGKRPATGTAAPKAAAAEKETTEQASAENATAEKAAAETAAAEAATAQKAAARKAAPETAEAEATADRAAAETAAAAAAAAQKAAAEKEAPETVAPEAAAPSSKRRRLQGPGATEDLEAPSPDTETAAPEAAGHAVTYPRDVPVLPGMPGGWKGVERLYGPGSKFAGQVYTRYYKLDGKFNGICSPKQVIQLDCKSSGRDAEAMHKEYLRLQKERQKSEAEGRKPAILERRRLAKLKKTAEAKAREDRITKFRDRFGPLSGCIVSGFPGWTTRWLYRESCNQTEVAYIDTDGITWKKLKDLENALQKMIEDGTGDHLAHLIEQGKAGVGPERKATLCEEGKKAKATKGESHTCCLCPQTSPPDARAAPSINHEVEGQCLGFVD